MESWLDYVLEVHVLESEREKKRKMKRLQGCNGGAIGNAGIHCVFMCKLCAYAYWI